MPCQPELPQRWGRPETAGYAFLTASVPRGSPRLPGTTSPRGGRENPAAPERQPNGIGGGTASPARHPPHPGPAGDSGGAGRPAPRRKAGRRRVRQAPALLSGGQGGCSRRAPDSPPALRQRLAPRPRPPLRCTERQP